MTVLGPMLIFAGIELSQSSGDAFKRPLDAVICLVTAGCIVAFNALTGFLIGSFIALACHIYSWGRGKIYAL
jgi:MFS superfamily sulfate permease-like transporter